MTTTRRVSEQSGFDLPAVAVVDQLSSEALVDLLTELGGLTERARARLALLGGSRPSTLPPPDDLLTAEQVAAVLNSEPSWVYRHARQLGGIKLDGLLRFPRRRLDAYIARQQRLGG